jgi:hypothetical protein
MKHDYVAATEIPVLVQQCKTKHADFYETKTSALIPYLKQYCLHHFVPQLKMDE